jgi:hypothetical protein
MSASKGYGATAPRRIERGRTVDARTLTMQRRAERDAAAERRATPVDLVLLAAELHAAPVGVAR